MGVLSIVGLEILGRNQDAPVVCGVVETAAVLA
jgi:hypothetical protein